MSDSSFSDQASLIIRALLIYAEFLDEQEIQDRCTQCTNLSASFGRQLRVDYAELKRDPTKTALVVDACAYYATSDDPWLKDDPDRQRQLLALLSIFRKNKKIP